VSLAFSFCSSFVFVFLFVMAENGLTTSSLAETDSYSQDSCRNAATGNHSATAYEQPRQIRQAHPPPPANFRKFSTGSLK
jgi:hypothetical protein